MIPVEQLAQIPLFSLLDAQALAHVAPLFHRVRYRLGGLLFSQGDPGDAFYVLAEGMLRARHVDARGRERVLDYFQPPGSFGETSLLAGIQHDTTLDVFSDTAEVLILPKNKFDALLDEHPEIKKNLNIRPDIRQKLASRTFKWLSDGEIVVVNTRRHLYALATMLLFPAIIAVTLLIIAVLASAINAVSAGAFALLPQVSAAFFVFFVVWTVLLFGWNIIDWSNDYFIVTNKRVIHFEKTIWFFEEREEAPIEQVADVQESALGVMARLLGFSDVRVETAGHKIDIDFSFAPRRKQIRKNIFEQIDRVRSHAQSARSAKIRAGIREDLQKYLSPSGTTPLIVPAVPAMAPTPDNVPTLTRQQRRTSLSKRLSELFGLRIEEQGNITWRKHWFILFERISKPVAAWVIVTAIGALFFIVPWNQTTWQPFLASAAIWFIVFNLVCFWIWYRYEDWRNDIYQVTAERILDIERSPFRLKERTVETTLDRVQNVSYNKPNLLANLFNFGDLIIETAGGQGQLIFKSVPNPQAASQEIFRRRTASREQQEQEQLRGERSEFLDWFMEYHRFVTHPATTSSDDSTAPAPPPADANAKPAPNGSESKPSA
jgi:CRP-like cAMP-binding protein/uncharacterized membrane protein YdbT with pleckstrin-like domain